MPHPLEHCIHVKVQTTKDSTPPKALHTAIHELINECSTLESKFRVQQTFIAYHQFLCAGRTNTEEKSRTRRDVHVDCCGRYYCLLGHIEQ